MEASRTTMPTSSTTSPAASTSTTTTTRVHFTQQGLKYPRPVPKSQSFSYGHLYLSLHRDSPIVQMTEQVEPTSKPFLNNGINNFNNNNNGTTHKDKEKEKEKEREKDEEGKKRRFSSFINYGAPMSNKRPNAAPIRVLVIGRPLSGKSSIISMLLNRDVHPGLNGRGIFVNNKPFIMTPSLPDGPMLDDIDIDDTDPPTSSTITSTSTSTTSTPATLFLEPSTDTIFFPRLSSISTTVQSPLLPSKKEIIDDVSTTDSIDMDSPSDQMAISPTIPRATTPRATTPPVTPTTTPPATPPTGHRRSASSTSPSSLPADHPKEPLITGRRVYHSDRYVITDIEGFNETNTSDVVGSVLEHRKWLEDSMQGYNIVLVVIKAQEMSETDRRMFSLCNALLHDMKDILHVAVTGCDMDPHWIQENEAELRRLYGIVKAVGVSFPSAEGGLLECIFEQMRKDSLTTLEEYISKNASMDPKVVKTPARGGSMGSSEKKKLERTRKRTFSR